MIRNTLNKSASLAFLRAFAAKRAEQGAVGEAQVLRMAADELAGGLYDPWDFEEEK